MTKQGRIMKRHSVLWFALITILIRNHMVSGSVPPCSGMPNCAGCAGDVCTACEQAPYFGMMSGDIGCRECLEASEQTCLTCDRLSQCMGCLSDGMGPVIPDTTDGARCAACGEHCQFCSTAGSGKCDPGACYSGFAQDVNGDCKPCETANCASCGNSISECDACNDGYEMISQQCFLITTVGPSTVAPTTVAQTTRAPCNIPDCATCNENTPQKCLACRLGFGTPTPTDQSRCAKCNAKIGCAQCNSLTQCTKCASTTQVPKTDGSGECAACATNCRNCTANGPGKCDACNAGYYLQADKTCAACSAQNCQACNNNICTACKSGFYLNTSTPVSCPPCGNNCTYCKLNPGLCDPGYCKTGYDFVDASKTCVPKPA